MNSIIQTKRLSSIRIRTTRPAPPVQQFQSPEFSSDPLSWSQDLTCCEHAKHACASCRHALWLYNFARSMPPDPSTAARPRDTMISS